MSGKEARISFTVEGMSCSHCKQAVEMALQKLDGVTGASVSLEIKAVEITYNPEKVQEEDLKDAIANAGYRVVG